MRKAVCLAILTATLWSVPAAAVNTEDYQVPYFTPAVDFMVLDSVRGGDNGLGMQGVLGVPFESGTSAIEMRVFRAGYNRLADDKNDFQGGLGVDYVRDFGPMSEPTGFLGGTKLFALAGFAFIEEAVGGEKHVHFGGSFGGGALMPLGFAGTALRFDARAQAQANNESCSETGFCEDTADWLIDYHVTLGFQMPMTLFFDRPVKLAPAEDCPVAVVDPVTGRRDCATDSDRDGVRDELDQCPGTPAGTVANGQGCGAEQVSNDSDRDGVPNNRDECAGTQAGLQVNDRGCVVRQNTSIGGVTFEASAARLTAEGRQTLDGVAETLAGQAELKVEIAGHTDDIGSDAYNLLLSQQRADAVRAYLIEKGIAAERLTAVGYGEIEPVATNETEDGRKANRRVEFRITTD